MDKSFNLSLSEEDYLNYQLFSASQSSQIKSTRRKSVIRFFIVCLVLAIIVFVFTGGLIIPIIYLIIAILTPLVFPIYQRNIYKKHYQKFIKENYKETINKPSKLIFTNDSIAGESADANTQIQYSLVESINEAPTAFYLRLKSAQSIIIPKNQVGNVDDARDFLKNLAIQKNIAYNDFESWKWR